MYVQCNTVEKQQERSIIYSERAHLCVALVIQHAKRMRRIILSSVASLIPPYFSTLSHK